VLLRKVVQFFIGNEPRRSFVSDPVRKYCCSQRLLSSRRKLHFLISSFVILLTSTLKSSLSLKVNFLLNISILTKNCGFVVLLTMVIFVGRTSTISPDIVITPLYSPNPARNFEWNFRIVFWRDDYTG
jgi:hypothetical protein